MSDMTNIAHYTFLPWLRQGIASEIAEPDTLGQTPAEPEKMAKQRVNLDVTVGIHSIPVDGVQSNPYQISRTVQLVGPGDVAGINRNALVRIEPADGAVNFEANCLPYIEFYEEDFPWRYSPAAPGGAQGERLRPWIILLVLQDDEFTYHNNVQGLPYISLHQEKAAAVLFPNTQSWAWAHVHFSQELSRAPGSPEWVQEITQVLQEHPDVAVSRVLCPRKLRPETSYQAFVVPAFETGRLAGLQEDPANILAQMPAWQTGGQTDPARVRPLDFPVYYQWRFKTGQCGDFKSLAMLLKAKLFGQELGQRAMDITQPGLGIDGKNLESRTLGFEAALAPTGFQSGVWPKGPGDWAYQKQLQQMVNLPADLRDEQFDRSHLPAHPYYAASLTKDPIITPPIYGQHHVLVNKTGEPGNPAWVDMLNLNPRNRAAAGLGVQVVQKHQDEFMEAAWKQIGEVNAANQKIREAELVTMVNQSLLEKRIRRMDTTKLLHVTAPMHTHILDNNETVFNAILSSRIPTAAKSAAMRKTMRPGRKLIKRMNEAGAESGISIHDKLIDHFNLLSGSKAITAAVPKPIPEMALSLEHVQTAVDTAVQNFQKDDSVAQHAVLDALYKLQLAALDTAALKKELAVRIPGSSALDQAKKLVDGIQNYQKAVDGSITVTVKAEIFKQFYGIDDTGKVEYNVVLQRPLDKGEKPRITPTTSLEEVMEYQRAFQDFAQVLQNKKPDADLPELSDLSGFGNRLQTNLNPMVTLTSRVAATLSVWSAEQKDYVAVESLQPVMAHPQFSQPVFDYLQALSQDYIIPNCDKIPQNSLTLLKPNAAFLEAFMAGLNHEMGRELLWREYPTDQRGTYFKKFWDTKDAIGAGADGEDIPPIDQWSKVLGQNSLREDDLLVLVIRGELLQHYPNTLVYAQKAEWIQTGKTRSLCQQDDVNDVRYFRFPLIRAQLQPDIAVYGFALSVDEAHGVAGDPGWFFVLKERPGQIRFGLDDSPGPLPPVVDLQHLAWANFVPPAENDTAVNCLDLNQASLAPGVQAQWQSSSAADLATYLFRNPVLFARHAREMLKKS